MKDIAAGMLGAALLLASCFSIGRQFMPQILRAWMPEIMHAVQESGRVSDNDYAGVPAFVFDEIVQQSGGKPNGFIPTGQYQSASTLGSLSFLGKPWTPAPPQASTSPTQGNWHAGLKEFTLDLTSGGAAGTYTLATARNLNGSGNGVQIAFINFYCPSGQAASGGTAVTVQSNDTTSVQYLASTLTAAITQGKNISTYNSKAYLGTGTAITFTTTGTFSAGSMIVAIAYGGQVGSEICSGSATTC
jgi:hypothetical protein